MDLEENKYVSVLFYWTLPTTARQVRVTGKVEQLPRDEVVAFIRQVPKPCYLKALAINQDEVLADRIELEQKYHEVEKKYASTSSQDLPIPDWVGYRILPNSFEFMRSSSDWLADRLEFTLEDNKWVLKRLAP